MCIKNISPKSKKYKFFSVNLWGRLFTLRNFKGRRVLYARINRRHTLKKIRVNAMKLRRKSHSIKGLGMLAAARLKNFYISLSDHKLKMYIKSSRKLPFFRLNSFKNTPIRLEDNLVSVLEFRVESILNRLGITSVQTIRQLLSHRKILLNGKVVTRGSVKVSPGDILSFKDAGLKKYFFKTILKQKLLLKFVNKRYLVKKKYPMVQPFLHLNKLSYFTFSL